MTGNAIVDQPVERYPDLHQFLAGWFHQDWVADHDSWEEVVDSFVAESPRSAVVAARADLQSLLDSGRSEVEVEALLDEMGCSADPAAFNVSAMTWLAQVRDRLPS